MKTLTPIRPLIRVVLAALALAATLSTSAFIVGLAHAYASGGQHLAVGETVVLALAA